MNLEKNEVCNGDDGGEKEVSEATRESSMRWNLYWINSFDVNRFMKKSLDVYVMWESKRRNEWGRNIIGYEYVVRLVVFVFFFAFTSKKLSSFHIWLSMASNWKCERTRCRRTMNDGYLWSNESIVRRCCHSTKLTLFTISLFFDANSTAHVNLISHRLENERDFCFTKLQ